MEFFETSGRNLLAAESAANVRHSRGTVGRRHRTPASEWLLPRKDGAGEFDQSFWHSVYDRSCDAIL